MANEPGDQLLAEGQEPAPLEERPPALPRRVAHMEIIISNILRYGVLLSFVVLTIGSVLLLLQPGTAVRPSGPPNPHDPGQVVAQAFQLQPKAIIDLGLMILIATPVFRVGVAAVVFLMESDYVYTLVSLFVFLVLMASFFLGHAGGG